MDFRDDLDAPVSDTSEYSRLNDAQLRSAIRFAEAHLRSAEEDHEALRGAYRNEITLMRSQLVDRLLTRIVARARRSSEQLRSKLRRRFERHATPAVEIASLVQAVSRGRTDQLDALSEVEAMALLPRLESDV